MSVTSKPVAIGKTWIAIVSPFASLPAGMFIMSLSL